MDKDKDKINNFLFTSKQYSSFLPILSNKTTRFLVWKYFSQKHTNREYFGDQFHNCKSRA